MRNSSIWPTARVGQLSVLTQASIVIRSAFSIAGLSATSRRGPLSKRLGVHACAGVLCRDLDRALGTGPIETLEPKLSWQTISKDGFGGDYVLHFAVTQSQPPATAMRARFIIQPCAPTNQAMMLPAPAMATAGNGKGRTQQAAQARAPVAVAAAVVTTILTPGTRAVRSRVTGERSSALRVTTTCRRATADGGRGLVCLKRLEHGIERIACVFRRLDDEPDRVHLLLQVEGQKGAAVLFPRDHLAHTIECGGRIGQLEPQSVAVLGAQSVPVQVGDPGETLPKSPGPSVQATGAASDRVTLILNAPFHRSKPRPQDLAGLVWHEDGASSNLRFKRRKEDRCDVRPEDRRAGQAHWHERADGPIL